MELEEYVAWVQQAHPGETLVYHVGELARDRGHFGPKMEWIPAPLDALASLIYRDAELGLVELTRVPGLVFLQTMMVIKEGDKPRLFPIRRFEYRATRTSKEL